MTQNHPQPGEYEAEVVTDGGEDDVGGVAFAALEIASPEMALGLHVADHRFDGGAPSEFAFDEAEDAALLTRDEDAVRVLRVMPAISLVDIGALNCAAGEPFGVFDDGAEGVAVIGIAWQRLGVEHELAARCAGIGSDDRGLDAELCAADAAGHGGA